MDQIKRIQPVLIAFGVLILATLLGFGWGVSSVRIEDTGIWQLQVSYQGIYVQAVADAFALDGNEQLAADRLSFICQQNDGLNKSFMEAEQRYGVFDPGKQANLDELRALAFGGQVFENQDVGVCNTLPVDPPVLGLVRVIAPLGFVLALLAIVGMGILMVIRGGEGILPFSVRAEAAKAAGGPERGKSTVPAGMTVEQIAADQSKSAAARGAAISSRVEKTDFTGSGEKPPLVQFMTTYLHGDEMYDDSFSIETASGEFLGETGVGVAHILPGEGKLVAALEVWLFDKNDIRTITKVLLSEFTFRDDAVRAKLTAKGDLVQLQPGDRTTLETATLRVEARIVDLVYGTGSGAPANSFLERITIELAAWKREASSASAAPAAPSAPPPASSVLP
ncbi:MAG: hypothetical protein IT326_10460 [Anaerolineae bacterium]|nr:hypothetical protein [Anaerolineae bacterium]